MIVLTQSMFFDVPTTEKKNKAIERVGFDLAGSIIINSATLQVRFTESEVANKECQ